MLSLATPVQQQPVDVGQLLGNTRPSPQRRLTCQGQLACAGLPVPSVLAGGLHLVRNIAGVKVLTPVTRLPANHQEWPGLQPTVILAHRERPNHWIAFM